MLAECYCFKSVWDRVNRSSIRKMRYDNFHVFVRALLFRAQNQHFQFPAMRTKRRKIHDAFSSNCYCWLLKWIFFFHVSRTYVSSVFMYVRLVWLPSPPFAAQCIVSAIFILISNVCILRMFIFISFFVQFFALFISFLLCLHSQEVRNCSECIKRAQCTNQRQKCPRSRPSTSAEKLFEAKKSVEITFSCPTTMQWRKTSTEQQRQL